MTTETPANTEQRLSNLEGQLVQVDARLGDMNENINARFSDMNENINTRFTSIDTRLTALDSKIDSLRNILIIASAGIIGTLAATVAAVVLAA